MKTISDAGGARLEWREPKALERYYELRSDRDIFATLSFRSSFGTMATAETGSGMWTFKRVGFLNPRVTVREAGSEQDAAVYQPKFWGDGYLIFAGGETFHWKPINFWATDWAFYDSSGRALVTFKAGTEHPKLADFLKTQATVDIEPAAVAQAKLPILVTLGWYLVLLHREDATAAAGGAVAATS